MSGSERGQGCEHLYGSTTGGAQTSTHDLPAHQPWVHDVRPPNVLCYDQRCETVTDCISGAATGLLSLTLSCIRADEERIPRWRASHTDRTTQAAHCHSSTRPRLVPSSSQGLVVADIGRPCR